MAGRSLDPAHKELSWKVLLISLYSMGWERISWQATAPALAISMALAQ